MLTNPRLNRLTAPIILGAIALTTGCAHRWGGSAVTRLDDDRVVLTELLGNESDDRSGRAAASIQAPGPSLVAGDGIAMEWAGVYLQADHFLALEYLE